MHFFKKFVPVRFPLFQHEEYEWLQQSGPSPLRAAAGSIAEMTFCGFLTTDDGNPYMF